MQDFFEFSRTHILIVATNTKPVVNVSTHAIWRRLRLVPFGVTIPESEWDKELQAKLRAEWPGILNWAIRGCLDWQQDGLQQPSDVTAATAEYEAEQDPLADFLVERCILAPNAFVTRAEIFGAYEEWTRETRERFPLDRNAVFERLRKRPGITDKDRRIQSVPKRGFAGLGLRVSSFDDAQCGSVAG